MPGDGAIQTDTSGQWSVLKKNNGEVEQVKVASGPGFVGATRAVQTLSPAAAGTATVAEPAQFPLTFIQMPAGNITVAFPTAAAGKGFGLFIKQDGVGSRTITWPTINTVVLWPAGSAITLTTTASKGDFVRFDCFDGTHWVAEIVGQNY